MATDGNDRSVAHDHFIYLMNTAEFENLPAWLSDNFHIIEGGTHAGGSSRNKLIVFKDGTYIELFNWITEPKEFPDWANKPAGLIDFSLTSIPPITATQNYVALSQALQNGGDAGMGVAYDHPLTGGRKRQDGQEVKWEITRALLIKAENTPNDSFFPTKRLDVPFFCHDISDRTVRVPSTDDEITTHPCGAIGISAVEVLVPKEHFESYVTTYKSVLGTGVHPTDAEGTSQHASFLIDVPSRQQHQPSAIRIHAADVPTAHNENDPDRKWLRERGIGIRRLQLTVKRTESEQKLGILPLDTTSIATASILLETD